MTSRREKIVRNAFSILDPKGKGFISRDTIRVKFDVAKNPDYLERGFSKEQILDNFLSHFPTGNDVSCEDFLAFYSDLSMSIASDEYFVRMLEATWACWEDKEDRDAADGIVARLLKELRERVTQTCGHDRAALRKIFDDFDINGSHGLTIDEC